ncbi:phospholipase D [Lycorma delicatula]|uniref:phospholipase D n=1 Tax=Lycorma delicatula TaxID=130591 RepID=UPI003F51678E
MNVDVNLGENATIESQGPASIDSDYDEYLAIPDGVHHNVAFLTDEKNDKDNCEPLLALPFHTIHSPPLKFKCPSRCIFIPGQKIQFQIIDHERSVTTHLLNPNLYTIELVHGPFTWTIKKRYKHFQHLHQQLKLFRASLNIPFPTKSHRERRTSFKYETRNKRMKVLPRFPAKPDGLVPDEQIEDRIHQLEEYLRTLLEIPIYRSHYETAAFLEVSQLSFVAELGNKGKEGSILKRTRSTHHGGTGCNLCGLLDAGICVRCNYVCSDVCGAWRQRWLVVKDTFVAYIRPKDGRVKSVMLYDSGFEVSSGIFSTGVRRGLHIMNLSRQITIKCPTRRVTREWMAFIKDTMHKSGADFVQRNRYSSFTPTRSGEVSSASWFVDGKDYMSAVADAMEAAKEEIFIADWWLSPEIHMKRPAIEGDYWRLDKILQRKATAGVKVFLLLYKEVEVALGINSFYSKQRLSKCHTENIRVLRHPDHTKAGVFLWAHHEKIVVIDQNIAFLGGIDLCYGRWDDHNHRLTDLGSIKHRESAINVVNAEQQSMLSLAKATNSFGVGVVKLMNQINVDDSETDAAVVNSISLTEPNEDALMNQPSPENMKCDTPEMDRKTILSMVKENVKSRSRDFMTLLRISSDEEEVHENGDQEGNGDENKTENYTAETVITDTTDCLSRTTDQTVDTVFSPDDSSVLNTVNEMMVMGLTGSAKLWIGKDYTNFIVKDFNNLDLPFQDLVDRCLTPRMPWHDIGAVVLGAPARDVARHFIQRWNAVKLEKAKLNGSYPYLLPKSYQNITVNQCLKDVKTYQVSCQIVRSVSHWSAGFLDAETWEGSIHEAYVDIISKAQHYIYIENQFFITLASMQVRNQVGDSLYKRILRAHREGVVFRVYVVIPLLPGFEGEVGSPTGTALHAITHWNYASISRGKDSLITRLKEAGVADPSEYISFHGLRTHSLLNGKPVTELIYIHSKLLIADDRVAIIGSANINDRSLLGKRDSEIAVVVQDEQFKSVVWGGKDAKSGYYCGSLRRRLFREHLGILDPTVINDQIQVFDPISPNFYHSTWRQIAQSNTDIYEKVFQCIPSDRVTCFASLRRYQIEIPLYESDPESASVLLKNIQGHLVMLPLEFLCNEVLTPNPSSVTGIMPTSLWT